MTCLIVMTACEGKTPAAPTDEEVRASLVGTAWVVTHVEDGAVSHEQSRCYVTLKFNADGTLGGQGPVNAYGGPFEVANGMASVQSISANAMGGDAVTQASEDALFRILGQPFRLRRTAAGAVLVDAAGRTRLRLQPDRGERCEHIR